MIIRAEAEGTDTYELNRNLVLTDGTRVDSVPNLEILTGEAACRARLGVRAAGRRAFVLPAGARHHLRRGAPHGRPGFLGQLVERIEVAEVRDKVREAIEEELDQGAAR